MDFPEDRKRIAVGMFFLTREDRNIRRREQEIVEEAIAKEGLQLIAWRSVPVDNSCLGRKAEATRPEIAQAFLLAPESMEEEVFGRHLLLVQKACTRGAMREQLRNFYVVSLSHQTVTYKGLLNAPQMRRFFVDLKSPTYTTPYAIFHQRFATNTFPDWSKAQPFRMLAHNGEINTIRGNRNNMQAREFSDDHGVWGDRYKDLFPMVEEEMSDSASFDNCLQLLTAAERPATTGVSIMMPSAWEENRDMAAELRNFYKYHAVMLEPWDGPAAIVFSDGRYVGASLDRNGLRPARFSVWEDGTIVLASETGLIPRDGKVIRSGRLGPGRMIAVDLERHRLLEDDAIKAELSRDHDYTAWCDKSILPISRICQAPTSSAEASVPEEAITSLRVAFGYDLDEENLLLKPMVENGKEAIGSMGDDTPLAVLSRRPRLLYTYFKQLFAQVTNPAIDSLRERSVMSLKTFIGGRLSLFDNLIREHQFISLESPVLLDEEFTCLDKVPFLEGKTTTLDATFSVAEGPEALQKRISALREEVQALVRDKGIRLLILSDRATAKERAPIPMLLAVGAVHSELIRTGRRIHCDLVCETGEVRDVHQLASVIGYGANAVYPYLALDMIRKIVSGKDLAAEEEPIDMGPERALTNYRKALDAGLLKILSKMGISTLFSYQGAKVFEAIGIGPEVIQDCFEGTASPIGGIGYKEIAVDVLRRHEEAFPEDHPVQLWSEGYLRGLKKGGEYHAWSPKVVSGMNNLNRKGGDFAQFKAFREASDSHLPVSIKDLLRLEYPSGGGVPLDEVEPVEEIRRRFTTAGMSLGALSPEMHETLAIAMNSIGGKSNSGEGGEDPKRFHPYDNGENANSAIKQVASGRFGVTAEYLANAREIEIKIAQGAKPGEGGQLMGYKVSALIASLRFSVPGVTLISPPPHHDIYSIEDLAQLIFDLKQVNPRAKVCVKLVASSGVGTIAAGVAKAYADVILIAGHEGGTGASPFSSIKHAGSSWEIGIAEAHQVLMLNDLRSRVTLRTDGGMKTGRDIVVAALLGAEEFNFGTAALIAGGCAMFRICHTNNCPVGVATQRDDLRAKFRGKPEYIINYFNAVAQDVRLLMSRLGYRKMNDLVGHPKRLQKLTDPRNPKTESLDFTGLLYDVDPADEIPHIHMRPRNDRFGNEGCLDDGILQEAKETVTHKEPSFRQHLRVTNVDRNIGTRLSGEIAYLHGNRGLQPGTIQLRLEGSAGQGLGAFLIQGIQMTLAGDANDYVGKGMNGGLLVLHPSWEAPYNWHENTLMGNTCLYGATGGMLLGAGQAGERFAVRNSGATAVIEGVGDHACEYMTGGTIICLGETGRNFGAGMSGGAAFVYDPENQLSRNVNPEMVYLERLDDNEEIDSLRQAIDLHRKMTGSRRATQLLENWDTVLGSFQRVSPYTAPDVARSVFHFDREPFLPAV